MLVEIHRVEWSPHGQTPLSAGFSVLSDYANLPWTLLSSLAYPATAYTSLLALCVATSSIAQARPGCPRTIVSQILMETKLIMLHRACSERYTSPKFRGILGLPPLHRGGMHVLVCNRARWEDILMQRISCCGKKPGTSRRKAKPCVLNRLLE